MQTVKEIMSTELITIMLNEDIIEAATAMKEQDIGLIPVVDQQNKCIGVVTDRDIVIRGIAEKKSISLKVEDIISNNIISVNPDTDVQQVTELMAKEQVRRLPVIENDQIVGIVSMADLANETSKQKAGEAISGISRPTDKHSQG
ncbi:CBS domain-containing protein [Cohnella sp.]|uniref:CBS domain-containing protein n=1 Tax=Cohnella sp. TaxID=1883426 RepID=UPI003566ABA9